MLASSLGRDTGNPEGVHGLTRSIQDGFLPNPFQFIILHRPNVAGLCSEPQEEAMDGP
jgi:hypothetical protein